jgi:hypothetical protein
MIISLSVLLMTRKYFRQKLYNKPKQIFCIYLLIYFYLENRDVYEIMWKYFAQPVRSNMAI